MTSLKYDYICKVSTYIYRVRTPTCKFKKDIIQPITASILKGQRSTMSSEFEEWDTGRRVGKAALPLPFWVVGEGNVFFLIGECT